jgi:hypothetical protein
MTVTSMIVAVHLCTTCATVYASLCTAHYYVYASAAKRTYCYSFTTYSLLKISCSCNDTLNVARGYATTLLFSIEMSARSSTRQKTLERCVFSNDYSIVHFVLTTVSVSVNWLFEKVYAFTVQLSAETLESCDIIGQCSCLRKCKYLQCSYLPKYDHASCVQTVGTGSVPDHCISARKHHANSKRDIAITVTRVSSSVLV